MIKVVHCKKEPYDIYIGRPSKWGNPFIIGRDGDRKEVIEKYKSWILSNKELLKDLHLLKGKILGCWCKPNDCHGDILVDLYRNLKKEGIMLIQGDVFLIRISISGKPEDAKERIRTHRGIVLAEGEATGHAHTIDSFDAILYEDKNKELFLCATKEVQLKHEEHAAVTIAAGTYKVGIVQEYDYFLEEARRVVD